MAVPDASDFLHWIKLAHEPLQLPPRLDWASDPTAPTQVTVTPDLAVDCLREIDSALDTAWTKLRQTAIRTWLFEQREFCRARNLVLFGRRKVTREHPTDEDREIAIQKRVARFFNSAETVAIGRGLQGSALKEGIDNRVMGMLRRDVQRVSPSNSWMCECVEALNEYYFGDSWIRCLELNRTFASVNEKVNAALQELIQHIDAVTALNLETRSGGSTGYVRKSRFAQSLIEMESTHTAATPNQFFPVRRNDATARERFLVFRIFTANLRAGGKPKAEAIYDLMGLEGIEHQFDLRRIERLCGEFTGKKQPEKD